MESSGFFRSRLVDGQYDRSYTEEEFARYFSTFIGNGVFAKSDALVVTSASSGMLVNISAGQAWINGYWYNNDAVIQKQLQSGDGILARIDIVVLRWSNSTRTIEVAVKQGTPASTPTAPAVERTADVYELCIAYINVTRGATAISQSDIIDKRLDATLCGTVGALVKQWDMSSYGTQLNNYIQSYINRGNADYAQVKDALEQWIAEVRVIVEENELDLTAVAANIVDLKKADKISEQFTYVIDNQDAFEDWANNVAGNDYTSVLIKSGTYDFQHLVNIQESGVWEVIDLYATKTRYIKGEGDVELTLAQVGRNISLLCYNVNKYNVKPEDSPVSIENVNIHYTGTLNGTITLNGFSGFCSIINCNHIGDAPDMCANMTGFSLCHNMIDCKANGCEVGFLSCSNLVNCESHNTWGTSFKYCNFLSNCKAETVDLQRMEATKAFDSCKILSNCYVNPLPKSEYSAFTGDYHAYDSCENLSGCDANNPYSGSYVQYFKLLYNCKSQSTVDLIYPVGAIYMSVNNVNPSTFLGGTWEPWGAGRVPVGIDTLQTEFSTANKIGGEKTHKLTVEEMPSHSHGLPNFQKPYQYTSNSGGQLTDINGAGETTSETGGNGAHNNLQPYITCYMWVRTA